MPITYTEPKNGWPIRILGPLAWLGPLALTRPGFGIEPYIDVDRDDWGGSSEGDIRLHYGGYEFWHIDIHFHCVNPERYSDIEREIYGFTSTNDHLQTDALLSLIEHRYRLREFTVLLVPMDPPISTPAGYAPRVNAVSTSLCEQNPWEDFRSCLTEVFAAVPFSQREVLLVHGLISGYLGKYASTARTINDAFNEFVGSISFTGNTCVPQ